MSFERVRHASEYLDEPQHDPQVLAESLAHVAAVNRWLGGRRALLRHVAPYLDPRRVTHVLDVGTGSADLPRFLVRAARKRACPIRVDAVDAHPQILAVAAEASRACSEITLHEGNVLDLPFADRSFDLVLLSLVLHHLDDGDQIRGLREMGRVARRAVIVGELLRSRLNYVGARLLAASLWRSNRLTRHDGPLSVRRAFTAAELHDLAGRAGFTDVRVHRHFFARLVLVAKVG